MKIRCLILIVGLATGITSCRNGIQTDNKITIATLKGPAGISMVKLIDDSNQPDSKAHYQFKIYNEPELVKAKLIKQEVHFAVVPTNLAAILYNKEVPYKIAAIPVWGTLYLVGSDTSIHTLTDLRGKTIHMMARGMGPDIILRYLLEQNKIDLENEVVLDYSFPTHLELAAALASGNAELGIISEPLVSIILHKNTNMQVLADIEKLWNQSTHGAVPFVQTSLLVHQKFARQHAAKAEQFLESYAEAINWVNTNQKQAAALAEKYNIISSAEIIASSIDRCNLRFVRADEIHDEIVDYFKIFYSLDRKMTGGQLPDEKIIYK